MVNLGYLCIVLAMMFYAFQSSGLSLIFAVIALLLAIRGNK